MRPALAFLLCLILPGVVAPQDQPVLEREVELEFGDAGERIIAHRFVGGEQKLVLVGRKIVSVLDVASLRFSETLLLDVPEFNEDREREISPDGRRMIVFGNYGSRRREDKVKRAPSIWDLQTGRQVATLDQTRKPIRSALWSKNGRILATSSDQYAPLFTDSAPIEVAFWDGETFDYKNSLPSDKVGRWYLTDEGDKCIFSIGEVKRLLPVIGPKYISSAGPVSVWDIFQGKIVQQISTLVGKAEAKVRGVDRSSDGKFMAMVVQPPKSKDTDRRLLVWEIFSDEIRRSYELKPDAKLSVYGAMFSPSGKFFLLPVGRNLHIYETGTGEKKSQLANFRAPTAWLTDEIFYNNHVTNMKAFDVVHGKQLYEQPLEYGAYTYTPITSYDSNDVGFTLPVTEVLDRTKIIAHPDGRLFLTYSNQYVNVFESRTGKLLQTLVSPPMYYTRKKPRLSDVTLVYKAEWSADGSTLYIIGADRRTVSLWKLL